MDNLETARVAARHSGVQSDTTELTEPSNELLDELREAEDVQAVCLFGSAARGEAKEDSDVDVLIVVPGRAEAVGVRRRVNPKLITSGAAQLRLLTAGKLRREFARKTVFAAHLAREGRVIVDRNGETTNLLSTHPRSAPVLETAEALYARLQAYDDLEWCGGYYLFCLSDLYAWGRSGAMLALARAGEFEFGRAKVFDRLAEVHPDLGRSALTIKRLRPFWEKVNRRIESKAPFEAVGSDDEAVIAREACRAILTKSL